ncbi:WD40/YVTN/BNR-like repeat-containing protein [Ferruginibacter sp.]
MKKKIDYIVVFLLLLCNAGNAQLSLTQKLSGKKNLDEIMQIVNKHLQEEKTANKQQQPGKEEEEGEKEIYFWNRWANRMSHCVDADGNIYPNINETIFTEYQKYKTAHPVIPNGTLSNTAGWIGFGPFNVTNTAQGTSPGIGRVSCIAFHPTDPNTFLIGTPNGGIWKTTNGGNNWYALNDDMPNLGIGGVCYDRTNTNTIFALTGDGESFISLTNYWTENSIGILKSTDGGQNWTRVFQFNTNLPSNVAGYKIIQHPVLDNLFFAITNTGIFRSADFGNSWVNEQTGWFADIEVKPDGIGSIMYASGKNNGSNYFYRSTDYGDTWTNINIAGITNPMRCAVAVSQNNSSVVYLLAAGASRQANYQGVFKSTNSGLSFTSVTNATPNILSGDVNGANNITQGDYDLCIESKPSAEQTVITGGINIWRRNSDGVNFNRATHWSNAPAGNVYVHGDIHNLTYNPLNSTLYALHDGGVSRSTDDGVNWTTISTNLHITSGVYADWLESNPAIICVGTQDNGTVHRYTSSDTYNNIFGGDGSDAVINQSNSNDIIAAITGSVVRTTNGGTNITNITPPAFRNFYPTLARSFNNDNDVYAADSFNVFRSNNRGTAWTAAATPVPGTSILTTCRSNTLQLYAGNRSNLYRSVDGGVNWTGIDNKPGFTAIAITDVEATHNLSSYIYATSGGYQPGEKVYYSTNAGDNWINISGTLPNVACHCVTIDAANNVYVGTDIGVFVRPAGQNDWRPYYNGLPKTIVNDLIINNTYNRLYAITYGHGNFYTDLYSAGCPANIPLTGIISGNKFYEATTITANASIQGGMGTAVAVSGTTDVVLTDGFTVTESNSFRAYNAPCGTVGVPLNVQHNNDPLPLDNVVFKAGSNKAFPKGHLDGLQNAQYKIYYEEAGNYLIRITDINGNTVTPVIEKQIDKAGTEIFNAAQYNLTEAIYYVQLLKDKILIHFLEYHSKKQSH